MMLDDSLKRHELFSRLVGNFYDNFPGFFRWTHFFNMW
jgi:hypothetical protein